MCVCLIASFLSNLITNGHSCPVNLALPTPTLPLSIRTAPAYAGFEGRLAQVALGDVQ